MSRTIELYSGDRDDFAIFAAIGSKEGTAVTAVDTGADELTLEGDRTSDASVGDVIRLKGHPDAGQYEVDSISYDSNSDETIIGTVESLTDSTVEGYVLFPWNVRSDFDEVRAQARVSEGFDPALEWRTSDSTLDIQDGNGTGDKMVFLVPPAKTGALSEMSYLMDVEGTDGSGDVITIIKKGQITLDLVSDVTEI